MHINEDLAAARNFMRPALALYVGGMGSREQNFYNTLVCEYGFERGCGRDPGSLPGRQARGGMPGGPGRADRSGLAWSVRASGWPSVLPRIAMRGSERCSHRRSATPASSSSNSCARLRSSPPEPRRIGLSRRSGPGSAPRSSSARSASRVTRSRCSRSGERLVERGHTSRTRPGSAGVSMSSPPAWSSCPRRSTRCSPPRSGR